MTRNWDAPWEEQASAPTTPGTGRWKIYFKSDGLYVIDDGGTEYGPVQAGAASTGELFLAAKDGWPSTTSGCAAAAQTEYTTNDVDMWSLDFDQTSDEYAQWTVWMPDTWNAGTITFKGLWTAAGGSASQTFELNLQGRAYDNDDAIDAAWGSQVEVSDALIATGDIHITAESGSVTLAGTPAAGEPVQFRAMRDATNDTLASDAKLMGIKVYYTQS